MAAEHAPAAAATAEGPEIRRSRTPSITWADEISPDMIAEYFPAEDQPEPTKHRAWYIAPLVALALACLGLLCIGAVYYAFSNSGDKDDDAAEPGAMGANKSAEIQLGHATPSDASATTVSSSADASQRKSRHLYDADFPLLCTMGAHGVLPEQYAYDDLCDFVYYTHVAFDSGRKDFGSTNGDASFDMFKRRASVSHNKSYGMSFHADFLADVTATLRTDFGKHIFKTHFEGNIRHHGILNIRGSIAQLDHYRGDILSTISTINTFQREHSQSWPVSHNYIAIGVELTLQAELPRLHGYLKQLAESPANILVACTHVSSWNSWETRGTAGATMWKNSRDIDQPDISSTLGELVTVLSPTYTLMVSFVMGVTSFELPDSWGNVTSRDSTSLEKPTNSSVVGYAEVCELPQIQIVQPEEFAIVGKKDRHQQFIFDSTETILTKVRYTLLVLGKKIEKLNFGLAVFDMDLEDYNGTCSPSAIRFERLAAMRREVDRLSIPPESPQDGTDA
ncbi:uncharacterized protein LOC135398881 [Ornithodoros turicata]|uniref:uncharacterized protein LOC135398881 n=1 Tax=Ornithodoros turicata TaxID=34597 RepID=UPI00313A2F79